MLLEHYEGDLPLWLAPDQIMVASINDGYAPYANEVAADIGREGYRVVTDNRSERLPKKVIDARRAGIPIFVTVGEREARDGTVSLRNQSGQLQVLSVKEAIATLRAEGFR